MSNGSYGARYHWQGVAQGAFAPANNPPTQEQIQIIADKIDEILHAGKRQ